MEDGSARTLLELVGVPVMAVVGYFVRKHDGRFAKIEQDARDNAQALVNYKFEAERYFAKDSTVQSSFNRVNDRLDEIADDIKTLIAQGARNEQHNDR